MTERKLTPGELAERERLTNWMKSNDLDIAALAEATGDHYASVQMMTEGNRRISQGFKWRFLKAFGFIKTQSVFPDIPADVPLRAGHSARPTSTPALTPATQP